MPPPRYPTLFNEEFLRPDRRELHYDGLPSQYSSRYDDRAMMYDDAVRRFGGIDVCPFCSYPEPTVYMGHRYHVQCPRCGADGPTGIDPPSAIIKWNERP